LSLCLLVCVVWSATAPTEIFPLSLHDALPIYLGGFDFDRSASLRVTAGTGSTFFHQESTETNQSNLITAFQCSANAVDHGVQCTTSSRFRNVRLSGNSSNQFSFVHTNPLYSVRNCEFLLCAWMIATGRISASIYTKRPLQRQAALMRTRPSGLFFFRSVLIFADYFTNNRLRLAFQRQIQHFVDPVNRHHIQVGDDVGWDLTQVFLVLFRDDHGFDAAAMRRQQLLFQTTNGQHLTAQG